ncbi:hypothetical protein GO730_20015 [Spirosoma sp. HMF3257]|uniref:Uncharacterized protein n=1 Tax=Spirosoma telluris TaxID=2183553 RepID=A0A327NPC9_9BACT|nr:hypothetical protein [Spirosoma telluris]RAI75866.1 hypothetical protein HMF3257_19945 [Spirosoma telluris]
MKQSQEYASKVDEYAYTQRLNSDEIKGLQNQLIQRADDQSAKSAEIAELYKKLAESQERVTKLTEETQTYVTGGDNYCYVNIYPESLSDKKAEVAVISNSKYPLYDVEIKIVPWLPWDDFWVDQNALKVYKESLNLNERYNFRVGTLPSQKSQLVTSRQLGYLPFDSHQKWIYTIDFIARNGEWRQVWEVYIDEDLKPVASHITYKTVIENNTRKNVILHQFTNPKAKNSIVDYLITEFKPFDTNANRYLKKL